MTESYGKAQLGITDLMQKQQEFTTGALAKFHERAWTFTINKELNQFVNAKGLMPFINQPGGMVQQEITEIQRNLGCSREEAINWIRARFTQGAESGIAAEVNGETIR